MDWLRENVGVLTIVASLIGTVWFLGTTLVTEGDFRAALDHTIATKDDLADLVHEDDVRALESTAVDHAQVLARLEAIVEAQAEVVAGLSDAVREQDGTVGELAGAVAEQRQSIDQQNSLVEELRGAVLDQRQSEMELRAAVDMISQHLAAVNEQFPLVATCLFELQRRPVLVEAADDGLLVVRGGDAERMSVPAVCQDAGVYP